MTEPSCLTGGLTTLAQGVTIQQCPVGKGCSGVRTHNQATQLHLAPIARPTHPALASPCRVPTAVPAATPCSNSNGSCGLLPTTRRSGELSPLPITGPPCADAPSSTAGRLWPGLAPMPPLGSCADPNVSEALLSGGAASLPSCPPSSSPPPRAMAAALPPPPPKLPPSVPLPARCCGSGGGPSMGGNDDDGWDVRNDGTWSHGGGLGPLPDVLPHRLMKNEGIVLKLLVLPALPGWPKIPGLQGLGLGSDP